MCMNVQLLVRMFEIGLFWTSIYPYFFSRFSLNFLGLIDSEKSFNLKFTNQNVDLLVKVLAGASDGFCGSQLEVPQLIPHSTVELLRKLFSHDMEAMRNGSILQRKYLLPIYSVLNYWKLFGETIFHLYSIVNRRNFAYTQF